MRRIIAHPGWIPVCIALVWQIVLMASVDVVEYDEAIFMDVARNIQRSGLPVRSIGEGGVFYFEHTPLYLYFLSLAGRLCGNKVFLLRLTTMGFALGCIGLVFAIGKSLKGNGAGLVGAFLLSLNPFFLTYSFFIYMEVPMCFFLLLAVYLLAQGQAREGVWHIWAAGLSVAVAVLLKEIALAFWAASIVYVFLCGKGWKERIWEVLGLAIPPVLVLSLWIGWGLSLAPQQFLGNLSRWQSSTLGGGISVDSRMGVPLVGWLQTVGGTVVGWGSVALFVVGGVWYVLSREKLQRIAVLLLLYMLVALSASLVMRLKEPRHMIGLVPITALLTGLLIDWSKLWAWVCRRPIRLALCISLALLMTWIISPLCFPPLSGWKNPENWVKFPLNYRIFQSDRYYGVLRDAGQYLLAHTPHGTVVTVIHEGPVVGYYADRPYVFLYNLSYEQTIRTLEQTQFLVVDQVVFVRQSPEEIQHILQYIGERFEVDRVIQDAHRQVTIYHRRGLAHGLTLEKAEVASFIHSKHQQGLCGQV